MCGRRRCLGRSLAVAWVLAACGVMVPVGGASAAVEATCRPAVSPAFGCPLVAGADGVLSDAATASPDIVPAGLDPSDLQSAYNVAAAAAADGSDSTVAIVGAYNYASAALDLSQYRSRYGLAACLTTTGCLSIVNQTGAISPLPASPPANDDWTVVDALGLDVVSAVCPRCHLLLVEADNDTGDGLDVAQDAAAALGADAIDDAWGNPETANDTSELGHFDHPGTAIVTNDGNDLGAAAFPASAPDVVAVGATALTASASARGWTETASSDNSSGCSAYEAKPSWQTDSGCTKRTVNDVAAVGDPSTPVVVDDSVDGGLIDVGSAQSAVIAAIYGLAGPDLTRTQPASLIYADRLALNDVTSGKNTGCGTSYLCAAGVGYDGPTGEGTPNGLSAFERTQTTTGLSSTDTTVAAGTPITLTATVTPSVGHVTQPSGTVTLDDGATAVTSSAIDNTGSAQLTTSTLTAGTHTLTATYDGDAGNRPSTSTAVTITVTPAANPGGGDGSGDGTGGATSGTGNTGTGNTGTSTPGTAGAAGNGNPPTPPRFAIRSATGASTGVVTLALTLPGAGKVSATATTTAITAHKAKTDKPKTTVIGTASHTVKAAGTLTIHFTISRSARARLSSAHTLTIHLTVAFKPGTGRTLTLTKSLTLHAPKRRTKH